MDETQRITSHDDDARKGHKSRGRRNFVWIAALASACVISIVIAFFVGRFVRSSHEEAIDNSRHVPTVLATVERKSLATGNAQIDGSVSAGHAWPVQVEPAEGTTAVVTRVHASAGQDVTSGSVLANVSGRPLVTLRLPFSLYRDIHGGDSGDDVAAIQSALKDMGLYQGAVDGVYGQQTAHSVERLYKRIGLSSPKAGPETAASLKEAKKLVEDAKKAAAEEPADASAQQALREAQESFTQAQAKDVVPILRSEITAIPQGKVTVVSIAGINTRLGNDVPLATLRSGESTVKARIAVTDKEVFTAGTQVKIVSASDSSVVSGGKVTDVSDFKQMDTSQPSSVPGYDITVSLETPDAFPDGQAVKVSVGSEKTRKEGTVVPLTAVREEGNETYVIRKDGKRAKITVLMTGEGFAMVNDDELKVGDEILVSNGR